MRQSGSNPPKRPDPGTTTSEDEWQLSAHLPRLASALAPSIGYSDEPLVIAQRFEGGQSNPTYLLRHGSRHLVLRKQPHGHLLPKAHDVMRECAIMKALHDAGFPVPEPILAVDDPEIIGTAFFLMNFVAGAVEVDAGLPSRPVVERTAIYRNMAETLAELHALPPELLASAKVGARPGFVTRQVNIWRSQYLASQTEPDGRVDGIADWLLENAPAESPPAIVHGDFRLENLILQGDRVASVLDWELCTIGEPLCDLGYCRIWYHLPHDVLRGLADQPLETLGIPSEDAFIDLYSRRCGSDGNRHRDFFLAFSFYRLAAILQGVYKRALDGNAASNQAATRGRAARICLARAEHFAGRGRR
jgi:aminoglycoside phosphotransferase (APT) family kinase protein